MPAPLDPKIYNQVLRLSEEVYRVMGCRGVTRSDFRYDETEGEGGTFYFLEINVQPGMTPLSLVPEIASYYGVSFSQLMQWIIEDATCPR